MDKNSKDSRRVYFDYYKVKRSIEFMDQCDTRKSWQDIQGRIKRRQNRRVMLAAATVAAVFALLLCATYYILPSDIFSRKGSPVIASSYPEMGYKKAILTLSDGEVIDLARQSGKIEREDDGTEIHNENQQLVYKPAYVDGDVSRRNVLTVPRGGEYQLVLSDGTKVWINAESSLSYPEVFGKTREVVLTGEAYFEVQKDSDRPFIVRVGEQAVEVLGTHFNISAYPESSFYTTLLEGKVKVDNRKQAVVLAPNEQAVIVPGQENIVVREVDAAAYASWIHGCYRFSDTGLGDILAQLSRWYNVEFRFADESLKYKRFAGIVYRDEELGFAINVIERVSNVRFTRDSNIIYVGDPRQRK